MKHCFSLFLVCWRTTSAWLPQSTWTANTAVVQDFPKVSHVQPTGCSARSLSRTCPQMVATGVEDQRVSEPHVSEGIAEPTGMARVTFFVPASTPSPFSGRLVRPDWLEVMQQVGRRVQWTNPGVHVDVFTVEEAMQGRAEDLDAVKTSLSAASVVIATSIQDPAVAGWLANTLTELKAKAVVSFDSDAVLERVTRVGGFRPYSFGGGRHVISGEHTHAGGGEPEPAEQGARPLVERLPGLVRRALQGGGARDRKLFDTLQSFYKRMTCEDLVFLTLVLVDTYVTPIPQVQGIGKSYGIKTFACMCTKCSTQIVECLSNPTCKACIDCLQACPPNDQVCAYRCITSYETAEIERFSRCILQKHNCMGNSAEIPMRPHIEPAATFNGQPMTFTTAEDLFIGWLGERPYSWKVVVGQNPAYDFFPCQHQVFYRGRAKGVLWYDPVFRVHTLDGQDVWRRRHYRVRAGQVPGTFHFSVLDNGVTSKEFWRIVEVAPDLSWGVFYYSGAAAAAGQSYSGALLVTPDGKWPEDRHMADVEAAFASCQIKMWELYEVDNSNCDGAPLGLSPEFEAMNPRGALIPK